MERFSSEEERSVVINNRRTLEKIFGLEKIVGSVTSTGRIRIFDEDYGKWKNEFETYIKLWRSADQSVKYKLS